MNHLPHCWKNILDFEFEQPYFQKLNLFLQKEYENKTIYPKKEQILRAFHFFPFTDTKIVILGQDPYHDLGQANGLSFSVPAGLRIPPSLQNIFKEIGHDLQIPYPNSGDLSPWAAQGILLLNATLTVEAHKAGSHRAKGWEIFTDHILKKLSDLQKGLVFIFWGNEAIKKTQWIDQTKHLVLKAPHPSPLSAYRGFMGCKHFSQANKYLEKQGKIGIRWEL